MTSSSQQAREIVRACVETGSSAAWQQFIEHFHRLIAGVAMRTAARWNSYSSDLVDDFVQETLLKLSADRCRLLREFQYRHPDAIYGYIKVVTANLVNDYFRREGNEKHGGGVDAVEITTIQCAGDPRRAGSSFTIHREILLGQVESCIERCSQGESGERDKLVFRLYYRHGFTAKEIAALPDVGLEVKGVESLILRLTRLARAELNPEAPSSQVPALGTMAAGKGFSPENTSLKGEDK